MMPYNKRLLLCLVQQAMSECTTEENRVSLQNIIAQNLEVKTKNIKIFKQDRQAAA